MKTRLRAVLQLPRVLLVLFIGLILLIAAGAFFYWIEPQVHSLQDGIWLAFTTGATVGYGDVVPSTTASRLFAGLMVLLGFALLSIFTAGIAALLVGEDERRLEREFHHDIRALRKEIQELRADLIHTEKPPEPGTGSSPEQIKTFIPDEKSHREAASLTPPSLHSVASASAPDTNSPPAAQRR